MYDVTARRHTQQPGGKPASAGTPAPVAAKAAAIDAAQARPLTWKTVVKRALAVAVAGAAIYLVLPRLMAVLAAWPRLSTLNPAWFTVCLAAELVSSTCNFALQRLALRTRAGSPWSPPGWPASKMDSTMGRSRPRAVCCQQGGPPGQEIVLIIYQYWCADMTATGRATAATNGNVSDRGHRITPA
jgi:hypothetical protein